MVRKLFPAVIFLLLLCPKSGLGQRKTGVQWHVPDHPIEAQKQLSRFAKLGISYLQIDQPLDSQTWRQIDKAGFIVYGQLPVRFPVSQTFSHPDSTLAAPFKNLIAQFNRQPSVRAIGIYSHGNESDRLFGQAAKKYIRALRTVSSKPLYYITTGPVSAPLDSLVNFTMLSISAGHGIQKSGKGGAYSYRPPASETWALTPVKKIFKQTAKNPSRPLFFDSSWLEKMIRIHPQFAQTLSLQAQTTEPIFPLSRHKHTEHAENSLIALMLLLLWIIFAVTYNFNPLYRNSFLRYFTGHSFFVDDVINRHIRNFFVGISILIQHGISGGIVLYCLFYTTFTPLGHQALYAHFPVVALFGTGKLAFFIWGFTFTLITEIGMVLWLWLANLAENSLSQIINLYPWPLQLNLVTATLAAAAFIPGGNSLFINLSGIVFLLLLNAGFIITCFDIAPYASTKRHWYLTGTLGVYLILVIAITSWIMTSPLLRNVVDLAVSLP